MFKQYLYLIIFLLVQISVPSAKADLQTSCSTTSNRSDGLVVTSRIDGSFGTSSEACVIDPDKAPFLPYKIPTYEDLKSLYYTQAKTPIRKAQIETPSNQGQFTSAFTQNNVLLINGDLPDVNYTGTPKPSLVFVDGNLSIENNITYGNENSGIVFVVKDDVYIAPDVTRIDAVIISSGTIYTAGRGCRTSESSHKVSDTGSSSPIEVLTINGSLISLNNNSRGIKFCRLVSNFNAATSCSLNSEATTPAASAGEIINYQPKYLVILRNILSDTVKKWSELDASVPIPQAP